MNPYASFLGDGEPIGIIESTPGKVQSLLDKIGVRSRVAPASGKWSPHEIVCHLADCEIAFGFRLRQTLAEPGHIVQPFDQDAWAKKYGAYDLPAALVAFAGLRAWNAALIRSASAADLATTVNHPERGEMTFQTIVETMAGHDVNHLEQLERIAG